MSGRSFERIFDAAGHNVVGLAFDQPIPWPVFDGNEAHGQAGLADAVQDALEGSAAQEAKDTRIEKLAEALSDLAAEVTEEVEGNLSRVHDEVEIALEQLKALRKVFEEATRKATEPLPPGAAPLVASHERLVRRSLALDLILDPSTVDCIAEALSALSAAERCRSDAAIDLAKQAGEARDVVTP